MTAGRSSRTLRAAIFAVVCVLFAAQGHVMVSGLAVPGWALAAGAVATGAMAWCLAGRERGLLAVGSLAVGTQVVLHASFSLAQAVVRTEPGGEAPLARRWVGYLLCSPLGTGTQPESPTTTMPSISPDMAGMSAMGSSGPKISMSGMDGMDSMSHAGHVMGGMSQTGMIASHLAAALLCGLWLAHGERAAFRVLRVLAGWLVAPLRLLLRPPAPPDPPRVGVRRGRPDLALRQLLLVHVITSRGPPAGTAVL